MALAVQIDVWLSKCTLHSIFLGLPAAWGCDNSQSGNLKCSDASTLDDADFTDDGVTYAVQKIQIRSDGDFEFELSNNAKATEATQGLTLVIGGVDYFLGDVGDPKIKGPKSIWTWSDHGLSWSDGQSVSVQLVSYNVVATGQPTITGGAQVGKTLEAETDEIEEPNGMPADPTMFTYQWVRVDGSNPETNIAGATSSTYTLTADDVGDKFKVIVSFTDFRGNAEGPLTSAAYPPYRTVTATRSPCPAFHDWCATMTVADAEGDGLILGYEFDGFVVRYGSLTDDQIPYNGEAITVWAVYSVRNPNGTYMYFESDPQVPRGTVVTLDGRSFTTNVDSEDGSYGQKWVYPTGELPTDLIWPTGQDVTVSVKFPGPCDTPTVVPSNPDTPTVVPSDWPLIPPGLGAGAEFRLLAKTKNPRPAPTATDIAVYNDCVQEQVRTRGHRAVQAYADSFRVLGSTSAVNARTNTGTTGDGGPAIYWLNGALVATNNADFYAGTWSNKNSGRGVAGDLIAGTSASGRQLLCTGTADDGTTTNLPLGGGDPDGDDVSECTATSIAAIAVTTNTLGGKVLAVSERARYLALSGVFQIESATVPRIVKVKITSEPGGDKEYIVAMRYRLL